MFGAQAGGRLAAWLELRWGVRGGLLVLR